MKKDKDFVGRLGFIDGITIINDIGTILFSVKFNPTMNPGITEEQMIVGRNLYEAFPNLNDSNSTLMKSMELDRPIDQRRQIVTDYNNMSIETMNLSLPIKSYDKIIGAIEISRDITKVEENDKKIIKLENIIYNETHNLLSMTNRRAKYTFDDIVSNDNQIKEIKYNLNKLSNSSAPVLIYGETGTGKELFAHAIHNSSNRNKGPFIVQNCAAIPENLLESILFGTVKGSFTGAVDNPGLFELAQDGTIFLDEINSMPINLQSKLLRVLEDNYIRRLGDSKEIKINVRVISSTNIKPHICVKEGLIRKDIYYRICVIDVNIPPLRDRKEDIPLLLNLFVNRFNILLNRNVKNVSKEAFNYLINHEWPGNIRELKHIVEYSMNIVNETETIIELKHVKKRIKEIEELELGTVRGDISSDNVRPLKSIVEEVEIVEITKAIKNTGGNVSKAAIILEIPRQTLQKKLLMYGIEY